MSKKEKNSYQKICTACGHSSGGNYCSNCGQVLDIKRITLSGLLADIFHSITNIEKGFLFTLRKLLTEPGKMQRDYINGQRIIHQKPFSMLFICASAAALLRYWAYTALQQLIQKPGEADFYKDYWIFIHIILLPLYTAVTYFFYYKSKYNYAEVGILLMYLFSIIFLFSGITPFLKFIFPLVDTVVVEFPFALIYVSPSLANFFQEKRRWLSYVKAVLVLVIIFVFIQFVEDLVFKWIS